MKEKDVGPRLYQVKYPNPEKAIADQIPLVKQMSEETFEPEPKERVYILGRLKALAEFQAEHQAPEPATTDDLAEAETAGMAEPTALVETATATIMQHNETLE